MIKEKNKELMRKIFRILLVLLVIGLVFSLYVDYNLRRYSIWYAQHMPHSKDSDPVLVMTVKNIKWINKPKIAELENYTYDLDGNPQIYVDINEDHIVTLSSDDGVWVINNENGEEIHYSFGKNGQMDWESNVKENVTEKEEQKGRDLVYSIIQPYIDNSWYPILNLQFIFNTVYYDQFN